MSKVKRAIILAAGKGTRLLPITNEIPKPLIKVNNKRIIDTILEALEKNSIKEIYIVVGYKKEQFYELQKEKPNIKIIENPYYEISNNISSLYIARDYLENSLIMDADQIIYNSDILKKDFDKSGYSCTLNSKTTKEWLLTINNKNIIISCNKKGGTTGWKLYSISRWNKKDGQTLKKWIEYEYENNNRNIYWDDVVFSHLNDFKLGIHKIKEEDLLEIDTIDELIEVDNKYKKYK